MKKEEKICTRVFNYGNEKESSWPPKFGTGGAGIYHIDKSTGELTEGYPKSNIQVFGKAPFVIQDSIEPYYHPAACKVVESRSALKHMDQACGTITTDKLIKTDAAGAKRRRDKERAKDVHESLQKAVAQIDNGTAPLSEETRALCERQNEIITSNTGIDAFNALGRKTNTKGRRYGKRRR